VFVFHIWLISSLPIKESKLVSGLVNKGYDVSAAAENNELTLLTHVDASYGVIACKVQRKLSSIKELYDDVIDILTVHQLTYYSLIISEFSASSMWNAGNAVDDKTLSFTANKSTQQNFN
jgi:hypothetical protein